MLRHVCLPSAALRGGGGGGGVLRELLTDRDTKLLSERASVRLFSQRGQNGDEKGVDGHQSPHLAARLNERW